MANKIILKKTSTAAKVPLATDLQIGEIAVNLADQKLYSKNAGGTVILVGSNAIGTVTSIGITAGTGVTSSGGPITTSGNITIGLSTKLTAIENLSGAGFITQNGSGAISGRTIQAGTGISVAYGNGSSQDPVITNTAPDQTVAFTNGTGISVTGTYPNFTVTNTAPNVGSGTVTSITAGTGLSGGTITSSGTIALANTAVTAGSYTTANITVDAQGRITAASSGTSGVSSVSGTAPIISSGGATPAISITQANTSTNGYLSSTDWNTFNGKQAALVSGTNIKTVNGTTLLGAGNLAVGTVTSVTATSPVASTGGATPVISMPAATTTVSGYLTSTDWNTFNNKSSTTGTVTSVSGTGTVNGLTLTGTVTTSGSLTLGGSLSGSGASLTALNATELTTGTVPDARISGSYTGMTNLTGSGDVDFARFLGNAADTVAAPSYSWTGDLNTGMYQPAADQIAFACGGVQEVLISATGLRVSGTSDTAVAATHYYVETATDGYIRPKTLANVRTEIVTTATLGTGTANSTTFLRGDRTWATVTSGASISNDTATATNLYPLFATATSGTPTTVYTSNANYLYKPSTGELQASAIVASNGLVVNSNTVAVSYTIPTGSSASSVGPMTVASGQTVTVPSGSRWVVL